MAVIGMVFQFIVIALTKRDARVVFGQNVAANTEIFIPVLLIFRVTP